MNSQNLELKDLNEMHIELKEDFSFDLIVNKELDIHIYRNYDGISVDLYKYDSDNDKIVFEYKEDLIASCYAYESDYSKYVEEYPLEVTTEDTTTGEENTNTCWVIKEKENGSQDLFRGKELIVVNLTDDNDEIIEAINNYERNFVVNIQEVNGNVLFSNKESDMEQEQKRIFRLLCSLIKEDKELSNYFEISSNINDHEDPMSSDYLFIHNKTDDKNDDHTLLVGFSEPDEKEEENNIKKGLMNVGLSPETVFDGTCNIKINVHNPNNIIEEQLADFLEEVKKELKAWKKIQFYSKIGNLSSIYAFDYEGIHYVVSHRTSMEDSEDGKAYVIGINCDDIDLVDYDYDSCKEYVLTVTIEDLIRKNSNLYKLSRISLRS